MHMSVNFIVVHPQIMSQCNTIWRVYPCFWVPWATIWVNNYGILIYYACVVDNILSLIDLQELESLLFIATLMRYPKIAIDSQVFFSRQLFMTL